MTKILSCPFCGSDKVEIRDSKFWTGMRYTILSTSLIHTCVDTKFPITITVKDKTLEEAINKWNKRF